MSARKPKIRRIRVRRAHEKVSDGFDARALEAKAAELLARDPAPRVTPAAPTSDAPKKPTLTAAFAGVLNARGELALDGEAPKKRRARRVKAR